MIIPTEKYLYPPSTINLSMIFASFQERKMNDIFGSHHYDLYIKFPPAMMRTENKGR